MRRSFDCAAVAALRPAARRELSLSDCRIFRPCDDRAAIAIFGSIGLNHGILGDGDIHGSCQGSLTTAIAADFDRAATSGAGGINLTANLNIGALSRQDDFAIHVLQATRLNIARVINDRANNIARSRRRHQNLAAIGDNRP